MLSEARGQSAADESGCAQDDDGYGGSQFYLLPKLRRDIEGPMVRDRNSLFWGIARP